MRTYLVGILDGLLHASHIPTRFFWRICDAYDLAVGVPDTPENFPQRHGFVRMEHIFAGVSTHPHAARCQRCGKLIAESASPCLLQRVR